MNVRMIRMLALSTVLFLMTACASTMSSPFDTPRAGLWPESDIAGIVMTANEGEVQQGNAAVSRATSADVRAFAQMMVTDHTTALGAIRDTSARAGIMQTDNDTTAALQRTSRETITNLATYSGAEFDRQYMQTQINLHQWLLTALDQHLIPLATNRDLRSLLETQRVSVAAHLEQARAIRGRL